LEQIATETAAETAGTIAGAIALAAGTGMMIGTTDATGTTTGTTTGATTGTTAGTSTGMTTGGVVATGGMTTTTVSCCARPRPVQDRLSSGTFLVLCLLYRVCCVSMSLLFTGKVFRQASLSLSLFAPCRGFQTEAGGTEETVAETVAAGVTTGGEVGGGVRQVRRPLAPRPQEVRWLLRGFSDLGWLPMDSEGGLGL
jgi:hypothetical protein